MAQTAMQQFMEFLEKDDMFNSKSLTAQQFLGMERQQIEVAYNDGRYDGENKHIKTSWDSGEKYYQQSYQTPAAGSGTTL